MVPKQKDESPDPPRSSSPDVTTVLAIARALRLAAGDGAVHMPLLGKNLGLLCEAGDNADAAFFRHAATELGAKVAHIRPSLSESSTAKEVQHTAHVLGRLYDAVECLGVEPALVQRLRVDAGVPVYDGIASAGHPTAALAELLGGDASPAENRRFVLQAVLLSTMA